MSLYIVADSLIGSPLAANCARKTFSRTIFSLVKLGAASLVWILKKLLITPRRVVFLCFHSSPSSVVCGILGRVGKEPHRYTHGTMQWRDMELGRSLLLLRIGRLGSLFV